MSTTSIIEFKDGIPFNETEFRNSWGGAPRIWSSLFDRYIKKSELDNWLLQSDKLWSLAEDDRLAEFEKAVLVFTFDYATVTKANFAKFADHLMQFARTYQVPGKVDHVPAWATLFTGSEAEAIGLYATSCGQNLWEDWDQDTDETKPYDLRHGVKHCEVYEWLAKAAAEAASAKA